MDAEGIVSLIGSLGFPIVMCLILIKYMQDIQKDNKETIDKLNESHKAETDSLKESLNNNTQVLTQLKTMFEIYFKKEEDENGNS